MRARGPTERDAIATVADVVDAVRAAFEEGVADFVFFNTSAFEVDDGGFAALAPYVEAVRRHFDTLVAAQLHPPRADQWIDRAYAMGVDALSFNLEIYDPDVLNRHCIGRARYIGRDRYLSALAHAATVFPSGTVWTDLILGVEPVESTLAGIDALADLGVVPVLALRHDTAGPLRLPEAAELERVLGRLYRAVQRQGISMGWVRDLAVGITPLEARWAAGDDARLALAMQRFTRSRLGGIATRGLARFRRRLRVRTVGESFESAQL